MSWDWRYFEIDHVLCLTEHVACDWRCSWEEWYVVGEDGKWRSWIWIQVLTLMKLSIHSCANKNINIRTSATSPETLVIRELLCPNQTWKPVVILLIDILISCIFSSPTIRWTLLRVYLCLLMSVTTQWENTGMGCLSSLIPLKQIMALLRWHLFVRFLHDYVSRVVGLVHPAAARLWLLQEHR